MQITDRLSMVASLQFGLGASRDCHVYALRGDEGVVLIDAGAGNPTAPLLENVKKELPGDKIVALLITHAHLDHCGGAGAIQQATGCEVIAPFPSRAILESGDEEASGLRRACEQGLYPPEFTLSPCRVDRVVHDQENFVAGGIEFIALHVRGHSQDGFCYCTQMSSQKWLFSGDTVFYGGVLGVINAEGSGMEGYRRDLAKLAGFDIDGLFPGHGMFTLKEGQRHIDCALQQLQSGFLGRQIGQGDLLF